MELAEYRDEFPILAHTTYLINHSLGAMPAEAERRVLQYARDWKTRGIRAWEEGWWEMPLSVGDQIGRIIGAPPGSTSMHQNVTITEAIVLSCFRFDGERRRIVYEEGNFPSVRYLYQAQADRGAEIVVVPEGEPVEEAIDERTLLVPVTHVLFKNGEIQDVEAIVRRAHEVGAHVVLDAYQSAGSVPLDVTALEVDFAVGGSVKWLCGGPGAGWLYVRPDLAERLEPTLVGWQAHLRHEARGRTASRPSLLHDRRRARLRRGADRRDRRDRSVRAPPRRGEALLGPAPDGAGRQREQLLGIARSGRLVLVLEVAVDVDSGSRKRCEPLRPRGQGRLVVGRFAHPHVSKRRLCVERVDTDRARFCQHGLDAVPGGIAEVECEPELGIDRVEQEPQEAVVARAVVGGADEDRPESIA